MTQPLSISSIADTERVVYEDGISIEDELFDEVTETYSEIIEQQKTKSNNESHIDTSIIIDYHQDDTYHIGDYTTHGIGDHNNIPIGATNRYQIISGGGKVKNKSDKKKKKRKSKSISVETIDIDDIMYSPPVEYSDLM